MTALAQDQLVRKEVSLGIARDTPLDERYLWSTIAPLLNVQSDDVIFQYAKPQVESMAPARAEDAESELSQRDDFYGTGRASLVDWSIKDRYTTSDVTRYREYTRLMELAGGSGNSFPLTAGAMTEDWPAKLARDAVDRRRKLERRLEWLVMNQGLSTGGVNYQSRGVKFAVDFGRPVNQHNQAIAGGNWDVGDGSHDPIGGLNAVVRFMEDEQDVVLDRVILSRLAIRYMAESTQFYARTAVTQAPSTITPTSILYPNPSFSTETARAIVEQATGLQVIEYNGRMTQRALGSQTYTESRFVPENQAIFLPSIADAGERYGTDIGFARTLTSPHVAGNWQPGFYAWEKDPKQDPWQVEAGTGIKAFPVFTNMQDTYTALLW